MLGLHDWLTDRGRTRFWQICGLHCRKAILLLTLLLLLMVTSLMEYYFVEKLDIPYPVLLHGLLFIVRLATIAIFGFGVFSESWILMVPFVFLEAAKIVVWVGYSLYYLFRYIENKINGAGGYLSTDSIVVPGAPSFGLGITYGNRNSNSFLVRVLGHILLLIAIHAIILWTAVSIIRIFRSRSTLYMKPDLRDVAPAHNVIVLEQPVEEAMYGRKKESH